MGKPIKIYREGELSDQGFDISEDTCPYCGSEEHLKFKDLKSHGNNSAIREWKCKNCYSTGQEVYDLSFIGHNVIKESDE